MTHHDAPISVLRAYTAEELRRLAAEAGLCGARVVRRFPFRIVLVWEPEAVGTSHVGRIGQPSELITP